MPRLTASRGTRAFHVEVFMIASWERRCGIGLGAGAGPEFLHAGLFGVVVLDGFTTRRVGVGLEGFGVTGRSSKVGTTLRLMVGARSREHASFTARDTHRLARAAPSQR